MASKRGERRRKEAQLQRDRERGCTGKIEYKTEEQAKAAQRAAWVDGMRVVEYHCPFCGRWHLGHPSARKRQSMRDKSRGRG